MTELFKKYERRDPAEIIPDILPDPIAYQSQREFVRDTLNREIDLRSLGTQYVSKDQESEKSKAYRDHLNSSGSPTEAVAANYRWHPGTELARRSA